MLAKNPCFQLPQNEPQTNEMTHTISIRAGLNGVGYLKMNHKPMK